MPSADRKRVRHGHAVVLRCRPVQSVPNVAVLPMGSYSEIVLTLKESRAVLRREIASIADGELEQPLRGDISLRDVVLMIIRHELWRARQIVVARRLCRASSSLPRDRMPG